MIHLPAWQRQQPHTHTHTSNCLTCPVAACAGDGDRSTGRRAPSLWFPLCLSGGLPAAWEHARTLFLAAGRCVCVRGERVAATRPRGRFSFARVCFSSFHLQNRRCFRLFAPRRPARAWQAAPSHTHTPTPTPTPTFPQWLVAVAVAAAGAAPRAASATSRPPIATARTAARRARRWVSV